MFSSVPRADEAPDGVAAQRKLESYRRSCVCDVAVLK
jgi:hypothetical protein